MTNLLCKVHPDAKKPSAYVVVTEPTGSEVHPLPAVGGDPVVQACAPLALQQAAHLAPLRADKNRHPAKATTIRGQVIYL